MLRQISVFLENKEGRLAKIMEILQLANIDIRAMTIADTTDFGIVRLIVSSTDKALKALKDNGCTAKVTDVIGFTIPDKSGSLYKVIASLNESGTNIEYCYSLMGKNSGEADIVIRVGNNEKALAALENISVKLISSEDLL